MLTGPQLTQWSTARTRAMPISGEVLRYTILKEFIDLNGPPVLGIWWDTQSFGLVVLMSGGNNVIEVATNPDISPLAEIAITAALNAASGNNILNAFDRLPPNHVILCCFNATTFMNGGSNESKNRSFISNTQFPYVTDGSGVEAKMGELAEWVNKLVAHRQLETVYNPLDLAVKTSKPAKACSDGADFGLGGSNQ